MRKTVDSKLEIRIKGGAEKANTLSRIISEGKTMNATIKSQYVSLNIYDIEAGATPEEIVEGIHKLAPGEEDIQVSTRAGRWGSVNATVKVPKATAAILETAKRIKIGWLNCRIVVRAPSSHCVRCWEQGHKSWDFKGTDRKSLCFNCGKEGHQRAKCEAEPYCPICNKEGHRFNERTCRSSK